MSEELKTKTKSEFDQRFNEFISGMGTSLGTGLVPVWYNFYLEKRRIVNDELQLKWQQMNGQNIDDSSSDDEPLPKKKRTEPELAPAASPQIGTKAVTTENKWLVL